ncbi:MAG: hypothetical protein GY730_00460 [bacterium]|nr:hypothetical protein [bacterium]
MKDFFEPHIERGVKNSLVLDSNVMPIFDKIKQDKEKGISLSTIKKNLLNSNDLQSEGIVKVLQKDTKTEYKTTSSSYDGNEWLSIKGAAKLSKKSEMTIRRLVLKLKNSSNSSMIKKNEGEKGKWVIDRQFVLDHFNNDKNYHEYINDQYSDQIIDQPNEVNEQIIELYKSQIVDLKKQMDGFKTQISELKEQLKQKDTQIEKQADDFKEQLNNLLTQKDQQIHQLHVLLKESKTSTIDYKPDENLGVFSKVLVKFGL